MTCTFMGMRGAHSLREQHGTVSVPLPPTARWAEVPGHACGAAPENRDGAADTLTWCRSVRDQKNPCAVGAYETSRFLVCW